MGFSLITWVDLILFLPHQSNYRSCNICSSVADEPLLIYNLNMVTLRDKQCLLGESI
jgi:hypothetical protein